MARLGTNSKFVSAAQWVPAFAAIMFTHVATAKGDGIWFKSLNNLVIPAKAGTHGATSSPLTVCGPMGPGFRRDDGKLRCFNEITTDFAIARCVNPIAAFAGMTGCGWVRVKPHDT
jgi:hypothetical protein